MDLRKEKKSSSKAENRKYVPTSDEEVSRLKERALAKRKDILVDRPNVLDSTGFVDGW